MSSTRPRGKVVFVVFVWSSFEAFEVTEVTKLLDDVQLWSLDVAKAHLNLLSQSLTRQKRVDESALFFISWRVKIKINTKI